MKTYDDCFLCGENGMDRDWPKEEQCPLCAMRDERDALQSRVQKLEALLASTLTCHKVLPRWLVQDLIAADAGNDNKDEAKN